MWDQEDASDSKLTNDSQPCSGLTTAGPVKNLDIDPLKIDRIVDFGQMKDVEETELPDATESVASNNTTKKGTLRARLSMTLPHTNVGKKSREGVATVHKSASTAFRKSRAFFRSTADFFRSLKSRQPPHYTCEETNETDAYSVLSVPAESEFPKKSDETSGKGDAATKK